MQTHDFVSDALANLSDRSSEKDVISNIVRPTLMNVLGYEQFKIKEEASYGDTSDLRPDLTVLDEGGNARLIAEVKRFNIDIYSIRKPNSAIKDYPLGQIENYLRKVEIVRPGTWGLLTNGKKWVVLRKTEKDIIEYTRFEASNVSELTNSLEFIQKSKEIEIKAEVALSLENDWIETLRELHRKKTISPQNIAHRLCESMMFYTLSPGEDFAYVNIPPKTSEQVPATEGLFDVFDRLYFVCLKFEFNDGQIAPADIHNRLNEKDLRFLSGKQHSFLFGIAYTCCASEDSSDTVRLRVFQKSEHELRCSQLFDLYLPTSMVRKLIFDVQESSKELKLADSLLAAPLKLEFFEDLSKWFKQTPRGVDELRHLIRILFVWLLKDRELIDATCLYFPVSVSPDEYDVDSYLDWLFTEILSKPIKDRSRKYKFQSIYPYGEELIDNLPYLNGSLFHELHPEQRVDRLPNHLYLSDDENSPGLITILKRYHWTIDEANSEISELAIDPNMLGMLFERLILLVHGPRIERGGLNIKMPEGAYYTPDDVVCEMTTDALAHWIKNNGISIPLRDIRQVVHPNEFGELSSNWSPPLIEKAIELVRRVNVLDPCVGSGAFIVGMLQTIHRTETRLDPNTVPTHSLSRIIEKQLFSVDKNVLAVHITRFRLFVSLIQAQLRENDDRELIPLPNLEFRHICANTLCTSISRSEEHRVFDPTDHSNWNRYMDELNAVKQLFTVATDHVERSDCLRDEENIRRKFKDWLSKYSEYDASWLDVNCFQEPNKPFEIDVRHLFSLDNWDIVIGNPPYQKLDDEDRDRLGDGYVTGKINLYTCFLEIAHSVSSKQGCIEFIVPHSIIFAKRPSAYSDLRALLERSATSISYRTFDNRHPVFPNLPWLKKQKTNRQRVSIITVNKQEGQVTSAPDIYSSGYVRLSPENRGLVLRKFWLGATQPKTRGQWTQAPTKDLVALLTAMRASQAHTSASESKACYFPDTAFYFITCLPETDLVDVNIRRNKIHYLSDDQFYWCWVGLYNSRVFFAYWLILAPTLSLREFVFTKGTSCIMMRTCSFNHQNLCVVLRVPRSGLFHVP